MCQVARDCGFLPLALAIAGSMHYVKGCGSSARWQELHEVLKSKEEMLRQKAEDLDSIDYVLCSSFEALGKSKQDHFMSMAILPKGVVAPTDMLMNLWEINVSYE